MGGSQGAEVFGKIVPSVIKMIKDKGYDIEINQQCIENQKNLVTEYYTKNGIKNNVFEFTNDIPIESDDDEGDIDLDEI